MTETIETKAHDLRCFFPITQKAEPRWEKQPSTILALCRVHPRKRPEGRKGGAVLRKRVAIPFDPKAFLAKVGEDASPFGRA